ncbi:MAG TPA: serine hydrolase domain-containing protein, partial [Terriglobia bacterium]|nr:serine hydrolase domain-containing protein [Terriglobia bacterium]
MRALSRLLAVLLVLVGSAVSTSLGTENSSSLGSRIDAIAQKILTETSTPSASLAVIKDNQLAYVKAYGYARLQPPVPANPDMRYKIGSVSKQFLAGAILLLVQDGKLSLDNRVSQFFPSLTEASNITIRELLSHTSGYPDYYPLDYVAPFMLRPVTPDDILDRFAKEPLNFAPGTEWQYSNTNYAIAAKILEKVSGMSLMAFFRARIFGPLGMHSPIDLDHQNVSRSGAAGYTRFGLGPLHPATPEASGWLYGAGELAMTARDLAVWDVSLLKGALLNPASLLQMIKTVRLKDGAPTNYALGVAVTNANGLPKLQHGGAVSGYVSYNVVWLDQGAAIAVLTNLDGSRAAHEIGEKAAPLLIAHQEDPNATAELAQAQRVFGELQQGAIDRSLLTSD